MAKPCTPHLHCAARAVIRATDCQCKKPFFWTGTARFLSSERKWGVYHAAPVPQTPSHLCEKEGTILSRERMAPFPVQRLRRCYPPALRANRKKEDCAFAQPPLLCSASAAAAVIAATAIVAAATAAAAAAAAGEDQDDEDQDPQAAAAAKTTVIIAHKTNPL